MLYAMILRFRGNRAVCATDIGKNLEIPCSRLPDDAGVGDSFRIGLNETFDGLTYTPISEDEHNKYRKKLQARRNGVKFVT